MIPDNSALQHDWHHYLFTENFGPVGVLDQIYGSNKVFKAWLAELSRRDVVAKETGSSSEDVYTTARKEIAKREAGGQRP